MIGGNAPTWAKAVVLGRRMEGVLRNVGFTPARSKIEVDAAFRAEIETARASGLLRNPYAETHTKFRLTDRLGFSEAAGIAHELGGFLSYEPFSCLRSQAAVQHIVLRGETPAAVAPRAERLREALERFGALGVRQQAEYVLVDTNPDMDAVWIGVSA